jgi:hypothetical protein
MAKNSIHVRLFWTALVVVAVSWLIFAYSLTPVIIEKAYHGESLAIFNHRIRGQANLPVTAYLAKWSRVANKVSLGLAGVYIMLALVGFARKAIAELSEPSGKMVMSRSRLWTVYCLGVLIFGGALSDMVRDTEHWPFSPFAMYSRMDLSGTYSTLRLYGVVQRSPLIEVQLDSSLYVQPFDLSRLPPALKHAAQENMLDEAMLDCLTRYEALRRAGRHDGPPLVAMRVYMVTWKLDPSLSNIDRPDRRDLLTEVVPRLEGGD